MFIQPTMISHLHLLSLTLALILFIATNFADFLTIVLVALIIIQKLAQTMLIIIVVAQMITIIE